MPVEIRELQITTKVDDHAGNEKSSSSTKGKDENHDKIIAECVEQVLDILKKNNER